MSYAELLRHPSWQRKRLEVLQRDNFACRRCGAANSELHVHHKCYLKGHKPWEYPIENFESLCNRCHSMVHVQRAALDALIGTFPTSDYQMLTRMLAALRRLGDAANDPVTRANVIQDELDQQLDYERGLGGE